MSCAVCGKAAPKGKKLCDACRAGLAAPPETPSAPVVDTPSPPPPIMGSLDPEVIISRSTAASSAPPEIVVAGLSDDAAPTTVILRSSYPDSRSDTTERPLIKPEVFFFTALGLLLIALLIWHPWMR